MVEVAIRGRGKLKGAETDVVESLVVNAEGLICVLHELMHGEGGIVRLDDGVRHLGRRNDGVGVHDPVGVLLADLGNEKSAKTGAGAASKRVGELESLQAVARLGFFADNIEDGVDKLGA